MRRRPRLAQLSSASLAAIALLAPIAHAASGGVGTPGGSATTGGAGLSGPTPSSTGAAQASGTVQASGDGITVVTSATALLRHRLTFTGQVTGGAGRVVEIERQAATGGGWLGTTHGTVTRNGSFSAAWPTTATGRFAVRAVLLGTPSSGGARAAASTRSSPSVTISVYRSAIATVFGPGFWGSRTACGQVLRHTTLGVANRTLPCGTKVSLLWHGRTLIVPVIDRGPYANGADWDLTSATAQALGIDGTVTLGALPLSR